MDYMIGKTGFKIEVSPDAKDKNYDSTVVGLLGQIEGLNVGKALFNCINSQCVGKSLAIKSRNPSSSKLTDICVANANTTDLSESAKRQSVAKGKSMLGYRKEEDPKMPFYDESALGTGEGTNCVIRFTPGVWSETSGGECRKADSKFGGPGSDPDCVLFHEIVHAYRIMTGSQLKYRISVDGKGDQSYEEFVAILISNIYLSDRQAGAKLRSFSHTEIAALDDPKGFLNRHKNRELVKNFCAEHAISPLIKELTTLTCDFNPIRDCK